MTSGGRTTDPQLRRYLNDLRGPGRAEFIHRAAQSLFDEARANNRAILGREAAETLTTDGVLNKPPREMERCSTLEFEPDDDVVPFTIGLLKQLSPYRPSNRKSADQHYREAHIVLVDGEEILYPYVVERPWTEIIFVNAAPYARKIERGLSRQRPNGVYEALVYPEVVKRYGDLYDVSFTYTRVEGAAAGPIRRISRRFGGMRGQRQPVGSISEASTARAESYPAIIVENY